MAGLLVGVQASVLAQDTTPPTVLSAVLDPQDPFQLTVTYSEPVEVIYGLDPFNYMLLRSRDDMGTWLDPQTVSLVGNNDTTFRLFFDPSSPFTPDADSILGVGWVPDLAGNPIGGYEMPVVFFPVQVVPANNAPVARAVITPLAVLAPDQTNLVVISANNSNAVVLLDGSGSWDAENDPLGYAWSQEGAPAPFATSVSTAAVLEVGSHAIVLTVSDGQAEGTDTLRVDVITAGQATGELMARVQASNLAQEDMRPLTAILKAAITAFDRGQQETGINQLGAFQDMVREDIVPVDPALADEFIQTAQAIVAAVNAQLTSGQ